MGCGRVRGLAAAIAVVRVTTPLAASGCMKDSRSGGIRTSGPAVAALPANTEHDASMDDRVMKPIGVLGAGSWGTALAIQLARSGRPVFLWARDRGQLARIAEERTNGRYLPGYEFPPSLSTEPELARIVEISR